MALDLWLGSLRASFRTFSLRVPAAFERSSRAVARGWAFAERW
jgi:hypothetical protein